jgi:cytochrome c1
MDNLYIDAKTMNHKYDKPDKWKKLAQKVKEIKEKENLTDEEAENVINFLRELAELEIRMKEEGLLKNDLMETK